MFFIRAVCLLIISCTVLRGQSTALIHGHAHNDYKQDKPLSEALELGFKSIEVDIFWHRDSIRVAHTRLGLPFSPSLDMLYLRPLVKYLEESPKAYSENEPPLVLMIDLKRDRGLLCQKLEQLFLPYRHLLCRVEGGQYIHAPLKLVLSGGPPMKYINSQKYGFLFADQPIRADGRYASANPYIARRSASWSSFFSWKGKGEMPAEEQILLQNLVSGVHRSGTKIRFWAIPDKVECWRILHNQKVDWINTDRLEDYSNFYKSFLNARSSNE